MWIRSAFWVGSVKPGFEHRFRALIPAMRSFPGVRNARALWPHSREDGPPDIACQVIVEFDSREDIERMLAAPERAALRPQVMQAIALFDGRFSHIEYVVGAS